MVICATNAIGTMEGDEILHSRICGNLLGWEAHTCFFIGGSVPLGKLISLLNSGDDAICDKTAQLLPETDRLQGPRVPLHEQPLAAMRACRNWHSITLRHSLLQ